MSELDPQLKKAGETTIEQPTGILLAERLALVRTYLEDVLEFSENNHLIMNAKLWAVLNDYPEIQEYWPLFAAVAEYFKRSLKAINVEWRKNIAPQDECRDEKTLRGSGIREATGNGARLLLRSVLGHEATGAVKAELNNYFLLFTFPEDDYKDVLEELFGELDSDNPSIGQLVVNERNHIPIILLNREAEGQAAFDTFISLKRRALDYVIEKAEARLADRNIPNPGVAKKIARNNRMASNQEQIAKSSLLGHLAIVTIDDLNEGIKPTAPGVVRLRLMAAVEDMKDPLSTNHDFFEPRLQREFDAVDSVVDIRNLYMKTNPAWEADRLTASLLSQFPFKRWGIVARMLEEAHRETPVPEL